ncbi:hypothetical protein DUNSADRAFT_4682 [Dunaliella salina]|uniref:Uncharacterized protein n=1 Tax=Dunaliella salina TaxID=3046 RepID=A0ABQ7GRN3_DUNSA|nr:hypothetical protein DUNSADRAFT_4682 [Dunaliella salina]|eukprot:KAF5837227.1 hypothetical protein DUNSADRAFT_4682 [Dunaliella salina]
MGAKGGVIQAKLTRIQHEPPAVFHAPKSHTSLKPPSKSAGSQVPGSSPNKPKAPPSTMPCHPHHVDVPPWPPRRSESSAINRHRHQRDVDQAALQSRQRCKASNIACFNLVGMHSEHNRGMLQPGRPADRVLAALGILPGGPHASPLSGHSGLFHTSASARSQTPNFSSARARRARHALSARRPPRPCDLDPSLELGGQAQAALLSRRRAGMKEDTSQRSSVEMRSMPSQADLFEDDPEMGRLGPVPGHPHPAPAQDESGGQESGETSSRLIGGTSTTLHQHHSPSVSFEQGPLPCASPEPEDLPSDSEDPPEGWPGGPRRGSRSTRVPSMSEPPPRHPKNPGSDSTMKAPACRGYYASKGGCHTVPKSLGLAQSSLAARRAHLKKKAWSARSRDGLASELDDEEQLEKVVRAARAREIAAEKKQAHVEYLAYHGMDGPRPCMYMGGKPI